MRNPEDWLADRLARKPPWPTVAHWLLAGAVLCLLAAVFLQFGTFDKLTVAEWHSVCHSQVSEFFFSAPVRLTSRRMLNDCNRADMFEQIKGWLAIASLLAATGAGFVIVRSR
jgi:hypothetical protein